MRATWVGPAAAGLAATALALLAGLSSGHAATEHRDGVLAVARPARDVASRTALSRHTTSLHYVANVKAVRAAKRVGFNVLDTGTSKQQIDALPSGTRAMVWMGQKCPTAIDSAFRAVVTELAADPKVYGYFLSDEPHISDCPKGPAHLAGRARFIRTASGGTQRSFIVLSATVPLSYHAFRPAASHVSLIGIDPYPCSINYPHCDLAKIRYRVRQATHAGIPRTQMVPTFQAFGQERLRTHFYNLPTRTQLRSILNEWARLVSHPQLDFTYSWGHQTSSDPTLTDSTTLKDLLHRYFHN